MKTRLMTAPGVAPWDIAENYRKTRKKKYEITICMPPVGTKVFNKLEKSYYVTDAHKQFVAIGTVGEQWVIDINKLCSTYTLANGTPINPTILKPMVVPMIHEGKRVGVIKKFKVATLPGPINWAFKTSAKDIFQIPTAWGDVLTVNAPGVGHSTGDYLVCADGGGYPLLTDRWVVNGEVFPTTYDMRAFANHPKTIQRTPSQRGPRIGY